MGTNSIKEIIDKIELLHKNGLEIFNSFLDAIISDNKSTTITITNDDDTTSEITVATNSYLQSEIRVLKATINNLLGLDGDNTSGIIVEPEFNQFREILVDTYKRTIDTLTENEISVDTEVNIEINEHVKYLTSPRSTITITIPSRFSKTRFFELKRFKLTDGDITNYSNGMSHSVILQLLTSNGDSYDTIISTIKSEPRIQRYYGSFDVLNIDVNDDDSSTVLLSSLKYSDTENIVSDSRDLAVGDYLINSDGSARFVINSISGYYVTLGRISGLSGLTTGTGTLDYDYLIDEEKTIKLPITGGEQSIVFLSPISEKTDVKSSYSTSIIVNTDDLTIIEDDTEYNYNTYYSKKILDFGSYLESLSQEASISRIDGATPDTPVLSEDTFKVVQINKHITNTPNTEQLKTFVSDKKTVYSDILILNDAISTLNTKIASGNYSTTTEKNIDISERDAYIDEREQKSILFASLVSDIETLAKSTEIANSSPKFRIRGFWEIDEPLLTSTGATERIVQYNIRYKYITLDTETSEPTTVQLGDTLGVISPWVYVTTPALNKVWNSSLSVYEWTTNLIEDVSQYNINQVDIPIAYGESVQFQVQAITEAGWPSNALKSSWSNLITKEFPDTLAQSSQLSSLLETNNEDKLLVEVEKQFRSAGFTEHISETLVDQNITYHHTSMSIASGEVTSDTKRVISQYEKNAALELRILSLEESISKRSLTPSLSIIDSSGVTVGDINNYSTREIFCGYYSNSVDINDVSSYGDIVEKTYYLKITNLNATSIELLTISSGNLVEASSNSSYSNTPIGSNSDSSPISQKNGQIIYLRNTDISGNISLVKDSSDRSAYTISSSDIDESANNEDKNVVHWNGLAYELVALKDTAVSDSYIAIHSNHPLYIEYIANPTSVNEDLLTNWLTAASSYNGIDSDDYVQRDLSSSEYMGFKQYDKYLISRPTCGAKLFVRVNNITSMQVESADASSSKLLHTGETNALLIPIVFQYRMVDALGRINGNPSLSQTTVNLNYKKQLGFDIIVSNEVFKFDVIMNAIYKPTTVSNYDLNISTISNNISVTGDTPTIV